MKITKRQLRRITRSVLLEYGRNLDRGLTAWLWHDGYNIEVDAGSIRKKLFDEDHDGIADLLKLAKKEGYNKVIYVYDDGNVYKEEEPEPIDEVIEGHEQAGMQKRNY